MTVEGVCCIAIAVMAVGLGVLSFVKKERWMVGEGGTVGFLARVEAEAIDLGRAILLWVIVNIIVYIIVVCVFRDQWYDYEGEMNWSWYVLVLSIQFVMPVAIQAYQMTRAGQTKGYRLTGIRVVNLRGGPPSFVQAFVVKVCSFVCLITGGLGFLGVYLGPFHRALPDLLGGLRSVSLAVEAGLGTGECRS